MKIDEKSRRTANNCAPMLCARHPRCNQAAEMDMPRCEKDLRYGIAIPA
jgi:hypothetical protein